MMKVSDNRSYSELAREIRKSTLLMTSATNSSHVGSCFSVAEILAVLYGGFAKVSPELADSETRDRIVISKGHVAAAVYSALALTGFMPHSTLMEYCRNGSALGGHVTSRVSGVELSTGSLGHGLPYAVGIALGLKNSNFRPTVFVVMSDGEMNEGTTWESALLANHHRLDNLKVIVDRNRLQSLDTTEKTLALEPLEAKWNSFGWRVVSCDGHNPDELVKALMHDGPLVILASTTKGKGVSFMEDAVLWHYRAADAEELQDALNELDS